MKPCGTARSYFSGYNLVTSAVEGEQKQVQVFYIAKHLQYKTQNAATI